MAKDGIELCNLCYMKLKEKEPIIVIVIRNGCFKGSDQIRRIPSVQSKCIMKTCRCSQNHLVKLGYTGYPIFHIFAPKRF